MKKNEGKIDRIVRVVAGLAILTQVFWGLQTPWAFIGLVPLITGILGFCPLYRLLGISTCPVKAVFRKN